MTQADLVQHALPVLRHNVPLCEGQTIEYLGEEICDFFPFYIASEPTPNAWTDGEYVYITAGMIRKLRSADEYRVIIGHEIGHILADHVQSKRRRAIAGAVVGAILAGAAGGMGDDVANVMQMGANLGAQSFSKKHELEADYIGADMLSRAGGDLSVASKLWRRLGEGKKRRSWQGSHPSDGKRFVQMQVVGRQIGEKRNAGLPLLPNIRRGRR